MRARFQAVTDYCTIWPKWRFLTRARETGAATAEDTSRPRTPLATLLLIKNGSIKNDSFRTALGPDAGVPGCRDECTPCLRVAAVCVVDGKSAREVSRCKTDHHHRGFPGIRRSASVGDCLADGLVARLVF